MWHVGNDLYLGEEADAKDLPSLKAAGITHVLNCAQEIMCPFSAELCYLHLKLRDPDEGLSDHIETACEFIRTGLSSGAALVHCQGAVSRSPALVLAYLCHTGMTLVDAAKALGQVLPTRPNSIFIHQIADHFGIVDEEFELETLYGLLEGTSDGD